MLIQKITPDFFYSMPHFTRGNLIFWQYSNKHYSHSQIYRYVNILVWKKQYIFITAHMLIESRSEFFCTPQGSKVALSGDASLDSVYKTYCSMKHCFHGHRIAIAIFWKNCMHHINCRYFLLDVNCARLYNIKFNLHKRFN